MTNTFLNQLPLSIQEILRHLSPVLAGFKVAIIVVSYFGIGSIASWIIERWYPFTRWLWDSFLSYLQLPVLSTMEKDALTAVVFFLPIGTVALMTWILGRRESETFRTQTISAVLGLLFVYAICGNLIGFVIENVEIGTEPPPLLLSILAEYKYAFAFFVSVFVYVPFTLHFIIRHLSVSLRSRVDQALALSFLPINTTNSLQRVLRLVHNSAMVPASLLVLGPVFSPSLRLDTYIPFFAVIFVLISVIISVFHTPKKLMVAAGAALAFILTAYTFELVLLLLDWIESAPQ